LSPEELSAIATNPLTLQLASSDPQALLETDESSGGLDVRADRSVYRLNPGEQVEVRLFATRFGQPYVGAQILLNRYTDILQPCDDTDILPCDGLANPGVPAEAIDFPETVEAKEDGAVIVAIRGLDPGNPRKYIDGQVYGVRPILKEVANSNSPSDPWNFISLLLFDNFRADDPPTWWGSLQPIFQQYSNLYPVMDRFLNLADYESVCSHRQLLLLAFSLEEENPNSMPVTRDLSAAKRKAILDWLGNLGQDGKPLLGTPPPPQVAPAAEAAVAPFPATQAASQEYLKGGKTAAASRRLALRSSRGRS
jgi:hypothetical protein